MRGSLIVMATYWAVTAKLAQAITPHCDWSVADPDNHYLIGQCQGQPKQQMDLNLCLADFNGYMVASDNGNFHYNENCNGCFVDRNAPVPNVLTCYCRQNDPSAQRLENSIDPATFLQLDPETGYLWCFDHRSEQL